MTVYRRPNGRWALQLYDPATRQMRQAGTFDTRREARAAETAARPGSVATVEAFAARWTVDFPRPAASTNRHNQERVAQFAAAHGRTRMDRLDPLLARRWALQHPSTVPALRAMWNDARRAGVATSNPFAGLGLKQSRGRRDLEAGWLTEAGIERLERACLDVHGRYGAVLAALVRVGAETGLRPGELFALDRQDLDGDVIHVARAARSAVREIGPPKNGRPRDVAGRNERDHREQHARPGQLHADELHPVPEPAGPEHQRQEPHDGRERPAAQGVRVPRHRDRVRQQWHRHFRRLLELQVVGQLVDGRRVLTAAEVGSVTRAERAEAELDRVRADRDRLRSALSELHRGADGYWFDARDRDEQMEDALLAAAAALRESEAGT